MELDPLRVELGGDDADPVPCMGDDLAPTVNNLVQSETEPPGQ